MAEINLGTEYEFPTLQAALVGNSSNQTIGLIRPNRDYGIGLSKLRESNPEIYKTLEIDFDRITDVLALTKRFSNEVSEIDVFAKGTSTMIGGIGTVVYHMIMR